MVLTRLKAAINYKEPSDDEMEDTNGAMNGAAKDGSSSQTKPKRKRARSSLSSRGSGGSKDRKRSRTGDPFTPLPLDVIYESFVVALTIPLVTQILGFLTPLDLLQLARTNKALRSYLMSKRSSTAWKAAR
ncbi:hypothetical protein M407DRAFT_235734, partial [Tulasnella calospora MUT 4182]